MSKTVSKDKLVNIDVNKENKWVKAKVETRSEIRELFNGFYVGVDCPRIDSGKVDFFVRKALNIIERKIEVGY